MARIVLRPHGHLFRQGVAACFAFMVPVFVVLYVLTIPVGTWPAVLAAQVLAMMVVVLATVSFFRVAVRVDDDDVTERGFFGITRRFERAEIGSVFRAEISGTSSASTVPQLFVRDRNGRQLIRLRGEFWSAESMDTLVSALDVPHERLEDSLSASELRSEYPGLLYWFERHPVVMALVFTLGIGIVGLLVHGVIVLVQAF